MEKPPGWSGTGGSSDARGLMRLIGGNQPLEATLRGKADNRCRTRPIQGEPALNPRRRSYAGHSSGSTSCRALNARISVSCWIIHATAAFRVSKVRSHGRPPWASRQWA